MEKGLGEIWPGWQTVRMIGRGSYGTVYEIYRNYHGTEERAALKVVSIPQNNSEIEDLYSDRYTSDSIAKTYESYMSALLNEYALMRKMNGNTNIVACDDVRCIENEDQIGWDVLIKMELLKPLPKVLPENITDEIIIRIGIDICNALILCGKYNIIHRDIKPQNIYVSDVGDFKLGDFGVAKAIEKTAQGTKAGTYKYMAPEVFSNRAYDNRADIYSLGLLLYWMCNKRRTPFLPLPPEVPTAQQAEQSVIQRMSGVPLPPPVCGSDELKRIILKACAFNPDQRYFDASEMKKDLLSLKQTLSQPMLQSEEDVWTEEERTVGIFSASDERFQRRENFEQTVQKDDQNESNQKYTRSIFIGQQKENSIKEEPEQQNHLIQDPFRSNEAPKAPQPEKKPQKPVHSVSFKVPEQEICPPKTASVPEKKKTRSKKGLLFLVIGGAAVILGLIAALAVFLIMNQKDDRSDSFHPVLYTIAAGRNHTAALREDGTVVAVGGENENKNPCATEDWFNIISVAAGSDFTVGLQRDGRVVAVGLDESYLSEIESWEDIVSIAAGNRHVIGLKSDNTVVAVGANDHGQCDVFDWNNITAVAAGGNHTVGLKSDGTVVAVGSNEDHQCDVSDWTDITAISAGWAHTLGLTAKGKAVAVGKNKFFQCNVQDWSKLVAVAAGGGFSVGLRSDGKVLSVGCQETNITLPSTEYWVDIVAIASGGFHTVGLKKDGTLIALGSNSYHQCDVMDWFEIRLPDEP